MDGHDYCVRLFLPADPVHVLLHERDEGTEFDAAPEPLVQPGFDVRVGVAEDGDFQSASAQYSVCLEISLFPAEGIAAEEWDAFCLEFGRDPVIYGMSGLDVVIAYCNGVVAHVGGQSREQMRREGVHVVGIIGGVVALETVSGVEQDDIVRSEGIPVFPDYRIDRMEGVFLPSVCVAGREPAAVHVCCGEDIKLIITVFQLSSARCCGQNCQCGCEVRFHFQNMRLFIVPSSDADYCAGNGAFACSPAPRGLPAGSFRVQETVQIEYQGEFLLHSRITESVREMCDDTEPQIQKISDMRFVEHFHHIVNAPFVFAERRHPVEWRAGIYVVTVFEAPVVNAVVEGHEVPAYVEVVLQADIPVSQADADLCAAWSASSILKPPVALERLVPAQCQGEVLDAGEMLEAEAGEWLDKSVIHDAAVIGGIGVMMVFQCVTQ